MRPEELTGFRYRGRGCPGPTRAETVGRVEERHHLDYWGDDATQCSRPWRCKVYPDGIGESADLAASETWPGGSPTREGSADDPGTNALITRTEVGARLLEDAARDGAITIEHDITPDDMSIYQPHQMHKKYAAAPRFVGIGDMERIVPTTNRLRLAELAAELAAELPVAENERQRAGTRHRIEIGKATEPTPNP